MPDTNLNLPFGVTKQVRLVGKNLANTEQRLINNITFVKNSTTNISVSADDPLLFTVVNSSSTIAQDSIITFSGQNELGSIISVQIPTTLVPADPAALIEWSEVTP